MASFGAQYPCFAKIKAETTTALPTYETGVVLGKLVKADLTVNLSSGELYADDGLAETASEFVSGSLAMETDDLTDEVAAIIYGATEDETDGLGYKGDDAQPYGGLGYFKVLMRNGVKVYKTYFYPKAKAALGNDSAATKAGSITFGTTATTFTIVQPEFGAWRYTKEFTTLAEAKEYLQGKLLAETGA